MLFFKILMIDFAQLFYVLSFKIAPFYDFGKFIQQSIIKLFLDQNGT